MPRRKKGQLVKFGKGSWLLQDIFNKATIKQFVRDAAGQKWVPAKSSGRYHHTRTSNQQWKFEHLGMVAPAKNIDRAWRSFARREPERAAEANRALKRTGGRQKQNKGRFVMGDGQMSITLTYQTESGDWYTFTIGEATQHRTAVPAKEVFATFVDMGVWDALSWLWWLELQAHYPSSEEPPDGKPGTYRMIRGKAAM